MLEMKTVKRGNSISLSVPKELELNLSMTFLVKKYPDGSMLLVPKIENPFLGGEYGDLYTPDVWEDMPAVGMEILDDY
ncbi:MAG: AbrB family transcriptional regulator [Streptococcaceae bacterium]|nr:AbrB family transcriptional regulator [Streptococcaceae bacterium]